MDKKNPNRKTIKKMEKIDRQPEREKELQEMDRIAKMLVRRDFELSEIREKREKELQEVERTRKALMNILEDVEEAREKAEEERNRTLTIISNLSDGLLVFDKDNKILLTNPQTESFFNVKTREILGKSISELAVFSDFKPLIDLLGSEIRGIFRKELTIKKDLTLEISTVPMMIGEEKLGTLVILHDITREKMVERIKTEFVSLAAHQLRTPLSAIKWTLKMLLEGDLGKITEEQRGFIQKTYQSNERMINLINDLLDVTRIEEGRYLFKPTLAYLENIVHFVINSYQGEAVRRKIKLEFQKPKEKLPKLTMDVEKMRLVVQNLIDNALKYTPAGGKVAISLKYSKKDKEIEFSIKDTGVGIPKDQQARVFTKFFRGANVMRMDTEGSGLGLFITKNIVEAHGGRMWFESKEKEGTTFYFALPVKKEFEEFLKEF
jgi:two-component system sensor histidine kinase VicK